MGKILINECIIVHKKIKGTTVLAKNRDRAYNPTLESYIDTCDIVHFLAFDVGGAKYLEENQDTHEFL